MKRAPFVLCAIIAASLPTRAVSPQLSDQQLAEAIKFGATWKSADKFLDDGLKRYRNRISGVVSTDGTVKHVTLLTDWAVVSAASADAHRRLRDLSVDDARKLPLAGLLHVIASVEARGLVSGGKLQKYAGGKAHLVLKFGELVVQPIEQQILADQQLAAHTFTVNLWGAMGWGQISGTVVGRQIVLGFPFQLTADQMSQRAMVILIDANGDKETATFDLASLK